MATDAPALLNLAECYQCYGPNLYTLTLIRLGLLKQLVLSQNNMADTSPQTLLADASCYQCYGSNLYTLTLMALSLEAQISQIGGGGTVPSITSFTNNVNAAEQGSTVNGVTLNWILGGSAITAQSINQGIGSLAVGLRTAHDASSFTTNRTYTLSITDGTNSDSANSSVLFMSKLYYGVSANTSLTDPEIIALSSQLTTTFVVTAKTLHPAAQYLYFAFPTSYGTPNFIVNGLLNTAWTLVTRSFTNASGHAESYDIYRSNNLLTGTYIVSMQ